MGTRTNLGASDIEPAEEELPVNIMYNSMQKNEGLSYLPLTLESHTM